MTDQEKMRKLFDAALRAPESPAKIKPAVTASTLAAAPAVSQPAPAAATPEPVPDPSADGPTPAAPVINAGLDQASSAELGVLLDAQRLRLQRRHRRQMLVTAAVLLGFAGGGYAWFIQSPERVQAFHEAMNDIRSVGDVTSLAAKYSKALEKIKVRSTQIGDSTAAMGVEPSKDAGKDPAFEKEMKDMTGGEGKTVGERNRLLKERFGSMDKTGASPGLPVPAATPPPNP